MRKCGRCWTAWKMLQNEIIRCIQEWFFFPVIISASSTFLFLLLHFTCYFFSYLLLLYIKNFICNFFSIRIRCRIRRDWDERVQEFALHFFITLFSSCSFDQVSLNFFCTTFFLVINNVRATQFPRTSLVIFTFFAFRSRFHPPVSRLFLH